MFDELSGTPCTALERGFQEDCPYDDITTDLLNIQGMGKLQFFSRQAGVISGTGELREFFTSKKIVTLFYLTPGEKMLPGDKIFEAQGDIKMLFKLWRISQTYLTVLCAIATETRKIVAAAHEVNPHIQLAVATRKAHLGMRQDEMQAVLDGGAIYHRRSLSDTIQVSQNHLRVVGELPSNLTSLQHKIEFEPASEQEAYEYAPLVDIMLLDHFEPEQLQKAAIKLKELNPSLAIGVAGGIQASTVRDFARYVDLIVLSSVLYSAPLDITCKISRTGEF